MRRNNLVTFASTALYMAVLTVASSAGRAESVNANAEEEIKRIELERNEAILAGDAAVVTGRARQKGTENRNDYSGDNRFTRVYIKQGDRWVTVALQVTLVEKP
jgi:ketosteroid isomerase-like protein